VTGKVLEVSVASGEYRNDTSAPVMTIADLSLVYVAADMPESQIRLISIGEPVQVTLTAFPDETFQARVARIGDTVDPQTRTIKVRAELKNPDGRLRPEMFAQIRHEEKFQIVPVVPLGAIVQSEAKSTVWRERSPGTFEAVKVSTGKRAGDVVPVLSGLKAGDRIVIDGAMLLKSGI
jgi:cobalt-zinc-cadmium efflux system membrane fusion protein